MMKRKQRCPKCGELGEHMRMERKQKDGSLKVWHEFIHKSSVVNVAGIRFREIKSGDYCFVGEYSPLPMRKTVEASR